MMDLLPKNFKNLDEKIGIYALCFEEKKYIGSSMNLRRRLKGYFHDFNKNYHHNKHVLEAFLSAKKVMYEILWISDIKISYNELLRKEEEFIKELKPDLNIVRYPTKRHRPNHSKTVYQYDSLGNYIRSFTSITEARKSVNMSESTLTRHLSGKFKRGNKYYWSYEK